MKLYQTKVEVHMYGHKGEPEVHLVIFEGTLSHPEFVSTFLSKIVEWNDHIRVVGISDGGEKQK